MLMAGGHTRPLQDKRQEPVSLREQVRVLLSQAQVLPQVRARVRQQVSPRVRQRVPVQG